MSKWCAPTPPALRWTPAAASPTPRAWPDSAAPKASDEYSSSTSASRRRPTGRGSARHLAADAAAAARGLRAYCCAVHIDVMAVPQPLGKVGELARATQSAGFSGLLFTETGRTAYLNAAV